MITKENKGKKEKEEEKKKEKGKKEKEKKKTTIFMLRDCHWGKIVMKYIFYFIYF